MAAFCHSGSYRSPETDGAGGILRLRRRQYLQDIVPVQVDIGVDALGAIVAARIDDEAIVCVDIPGWVRVCGER